VLPNAEHAPTVPLQRACNKHIPDLVSGQFRLPEFLVSRGLRRVSGTAVPKTPVYEYRDLMQRKNEIGIAKYPRAATPTRNLVPAQNRD
jgi:hypothetical protein